MVFTSTEQEVRTTIDLSALAKFMTNTINVTRAHETERISISLDTEYENLREQLPTQSLHGETTSVHKITPSQMEERVGKGASEVRVPPLEWSVNTHPVLTNQVRTMIKTLWAIVVSRSSQLRFPLSKTVVSISTDPTEGESKAILRLDCNTNISQALAFWDSLEPDLQGWLTNLTEHERVVFITKLSLRVYWL